MALDKDKKCSQLLSLTKTLSHNHKIIGNNLQIPSSIWSVERQHEIQVFKILFVTTEGYLNRYEACQSFWSEKPTPILSNRAASCINSAYKI